MLHPARAIRPAVRPRRGRLAFPTLILLILCGNPAMALEVWKMWTAGEPDDDFGRSVAVVGESIIVGAPLSNQGGVDSGAVYVIENDTVTPLLLRGLVGQDRAGYAVAASGTTQAEVVAVTTARSRILSFARDGSGVWQDLQTINGSDYGITGGIYLSLSLRGDLLAVGDPYADQGLGKVFLFARQGDSWVRDANVPPYSGAVDHVGWSVSLGDDLLAAAGSSAAYVFSYDRVTNWSSPKRLEIPALSSEELSVALDGDLLAVGIPLLFPANGEVRLFRRHHGGSDHWGEIQVLRPTAPRPEVFNPPDSGDLFGVSVALRGGRLVVGAPGDDNACEGGYDIGCNAGSVYIFDRNPATGMFEEALELTGPGTDDLARLGVSVAFEGDRVVAGAPHFGTVLAEGEVHVFDVGVRTADLVVTKTDGVSSVLAGEALTYTIEVKNLGPGLVSGAVVEDLFSGHLTGVRWRCQPAGIASCLREGRQRIRERVDLLPGASLTYTAEANVRHWVQGGSLTNTVSVRLPLGMTDPYPADNLARDRDTLFADCNRNGVVDATDITAGTSADLNGNGMPDECETRAGTWGLHGTAAGGQLTATLWGFSGSCTVSVVTVAGQSAATVAENWAAAINADPCLAAQGITATASGSAVTIQGFLFDAAGSTLGTTDPGLSFALALADIPVVSPTGLAALTLLLLAAGTWLLRR